VSSSRRGGDVATGASSASPAAGSKAPMRGVRTGGVHVGGSGSAPIAPASSGGPSSKYVVSNTLSGPSAVVHADAGSVLPIASLASKLSVYQVYIAET
jgi:hypothetical protein